MIQILALDQKNSPIAETSHADTALLCVNREWAEGDSIEIISDPGCHLMVQMDVTLGESEVYLPDGKMSWPIPWGEHRLAYAPGAFAGSRHIITARKMIESELRTVRDLARNPADLRGDTNFYPHCTANVETRNESVFAARNVIDGLRFNTSHGEWPYESWGIGARTDAWCKIDFGREIIAQCMALTLRADFPHDAYWVSGHAVDSSGTEIAFDLKKTGERQWVDLGGRRLRWLRLERMIKSDDPSAFPSLRAWEVYGTEIRDE